MTLAAAAPGSGDGGPGQGADGAAGASASAALLDRPGGVVTELAWSSCLTPPEPVDFSAEWAHKDLEYAARMAGGLPHPVLDGVLSLFGTAPAEGRGKEDWSTVNPTAAGS